MTNGKRPFRKPGLAAKVRAKMFAAQRGLCHICGEPMDLKRRGRRPDSPPGPGFATFDHLVARANGGPNAQANIKLAHKRCNEQRGDRATYTRGGDV